MFCQMGKGKRAQLYNMLGFGGQPGRSGMLFLPNPCFQGWSRAPLGLAALLLPSQVSNLTQQQAVSEVMDRLLHPTHRVPVLLLLCLLQRL